MLCPYKNHMRSDLKAALTLNNYEACLKNNRHEWFYDTVEGMSRRFCTHYERYGHSVH